MSSDYSMTMRNVLCRHCGKKHEVKIRRVGLFEVRTCPNMPDGEVRVEVPPALEVKR